MATDAKGPVAEAGGEGPEDSSLEGGNYEVIKGRLVEQGNALRTALEALNKRRKEVFGGTDLTVIGNERIRTENNCVPRDMLHVQGKLWFGYNVFVGLKKETGIADVFGLHRFTTKADGTLDLGNLTGRGEGPPGLVSDDATAESLFLHENFIKEFQELYRYYREAKLLRLEKTETRLFATFQTGASVSEQKIFRWTVHPDGGISYLDNRGDAERPEVPAYDFPWTETTRENQVPGRYPHLSILDELFLETTGGDLTIKVENNTETGKGIYAEPVEDANQSLDDGEFAYAKLGNLILLRILPFREETARYFVFNRRSQSVTRIDALSLACRQLPENHGIVFPGGYYLDSGEYKIFDDAVDGLRMDQMLRSPNGEDVLYCFHRPDEGRYVLLSYNLIRKEAASPIQCHGYSLFDDGKMLVFRSLSDEPTRIHPVQVWQTPFFTAAHAAEAPTDNSFLAKVGNADLVRGISEAHGIRQLALSEQPSRQTFDDIVELSGALLDNFYWLEHDEVKLEAPLRALQQTAALIIDEFEKVQAMKARARTAVEEAATAQEALLRELQSEAPSDVEQFMRSLTALRHQRGHLITVREMRYADEAALGDLEATVVEQFEALSRDCVRFLLGDDALGPLQSSLDQLLQDGSAAERTSDLNPMMERLEESAEGLNVVSEVVAGLEVDDATARTTILDGISEVFSKLNRTRATLQGRKQQLLETEGRAEFAAQFNLLSQSVASGLTMADTPERCDEQLSRLMMQVEELEARFSELDTFLEDIQQKREEIYEAFSSKKQSLLDAQQRRGEGLMAAAERILAGVARRSGSFSEQDDLNSYFASDAMVMKLRQIGTQLRELGSGVKADEVDARLKASRQDALRGLRDKLELFDDDALIKFGQHRFTVNREPLELTMVPRGGGMALHLTGTDFYDAIEDEAFSATRAFWPQTFVSETEDVYRGEYLAASLLFAAEASGDGALTLDSLHAAAREDGGLLKLVRSAATDRYDEGYERGVHDADAARILEKLLMLRESAGLLRFSPAARALAALFWGRFQDTPGGIRLRRSAQSLGRLRQGYGASQEYLNQLSEELVPPVVRLGESLGLPEVAQLGGSAARYLALELARSAEEGGVVRLVSSEAGRTLCAQFRKRLEEEGSLSRLLEDLQSLGTSAEENPREEPQAWEATVAAQWRLIQAWLEAFFRKTAGAAEAIAPEEAIAEAAAMLLTEGTLDREDSTALTEAQVDGLLGQHPRLHSAETSGQSGQVLALRLDEFYGRLGPFLRERVPAFRAYQKTRHALLESERKRLRLDEYKPKVMSAFVRNKLINDVYLPIIGDNLAKQLGAAGEAKRTDLMGLLLLVSPPGYGKTTLTEYVASRLGLVFMKVNGPALGHSVTSLDPKEASSATARQEVEKINLAFEMGSNVMLYLDDIQHTHPELLQKFISLCDAQRRIEGVYKGVTRTYDLRGKKFCVVMAGNPYTESGDKFQIPDMLANRADTYNLGDILSGKEDAFAMSFVENSLTSNPTLQPLTTRESSDIYALFRMAAGEEVPSSSLSAGYSAAELSEVQAVLQRVFKLRDVLLRVNAEYIRSASQEDAFRSEPPFKLQGSYRNMNKLAEKVVSAMNDEELEALLDDHYRGESQTLTSGAEQNLLKLQELRGRLTEEEQVRWNDIKEGFQKQRAMGGGEDDPVTRVTGSLGLLSNDLSSIRKALDDAGAALAQQTAKAERAASPSTEEAGLQDTLAALLAQQEEGWAKIAARTGNSEQLLGDLVSTLAAPLKGLEAALQAVQRPQLEVTVQAPGSAGPWTGQPSGPSSEPTAGDSGEAKSPYSVAKVPPSRPPGALEHQLHAHFQKLEQTLLPLIQRANQDLADSKELHNHVVQLLELIQRVEGKLRSTAPKGKA